MAKYKLMTSEPTSDFILSFAAKRAQEIWDKSGQPYLLAYLSPELSDIGINYKDVLGGQRLKEFVESAPERVKVVSHPVQKAKIGLIPPDKDFEYPLEPKSATGKTNSTPASGERSKGGRRRFIVSNFLELLSELDDDDAAQVQIPTSILTKLLRDK